MTRTGWGYDAHRFGGPGPLILCGVEVPSDSGLVGTSDADVALHAVIDAILGATALGDIGELFPSTDPAWHPEHGELPDGRLNVERLLCE